MADLELFHQSITKTRHTITPDTKSEEDDQGLALGFPYLMHSTLALAALHLYSGQPHRLELLSRAATHQHAALSLVRPHIIDSTPEHSQAILGFAAITSIFALAEPAYDPRGLGVARDPIDELLNSFHLGRGIKTIIMQRWEVLRHDPSMQKVAVLPDYSALKPTLDDRYPVYPALRSFVSQHCHGDEEESCLNAVGELFWYMAIMEEYAQKVPGPMYIQMWPIHLSAIFLDMLADRHPISLIVLAHYAALMRMRSNTWWLERWPLAVLQHVSTIIDPALIIHLEWPRSKIAQLDQAFPSPTETVAT